MKKLNFVLIGLCAILFNGCADELDETIYTISGHFYQDCNMEPVRNTKIILFENSNNGGAVAGGELATTVTDSLGYFKFEFQDKKGINLIFRITSGAGFRNVMTDIPARTSIDNLIVYYNATTNIQVRLNVINPHTSSDTLVIAGYKTMQDLYIPGPFTSGELYTATNFPLLLMNYKGEKKTLTWYFAPYNGTFSSEPYVINKYCNDTIFVTATIN